MQMAICQICKEPIWTFICSDCLAKDIKNWLPKKLSSGFSRFNDSITRNFHVFFSGVSLPCIHCKQPKPAPLCAFCYIKEATEWLKSKNSDFADKLSSMLSISQESSSIQPVAEFGRDDVEEGVCEYCGIFSNELMFQNGKWVCKECEELEH